MSGQDIFILLRIGIGKEGCIIVKQCFLKMLKVQVEQTENTSCLHLYWAILATKD